MPSALPFVRSLGFPRRAFATIALLTGCTLAAASAVADQWPNWRGPQSNGVAPQGSYPLQWNLETSENVLWKVPMEERTGSTPAVWDDLIFVTTGSGGKNVLRAYDWKGEKRWEITAGEEVPGKHKKGSGSNPSPVTDGKQVFAYFKSGDVACVDFTGKLLWHKNLQKEFATDTLWWDLGTSPVLTNDHLVIACVQSGPSYLAGFDKRTGEVAWKVDRMLDAPEEANQTYSTPLVLEHQGRQMLVVLGADHVTGHEAKDGKELWRVGGFNPDQDKYFRSISSPVAANGIILAPYSRGTTLTAISLEGKQLWRKAEISADVPTPAAADDRAYVCNDQGRVACVALKTGEIEWSVETGKNRNAFSASPILAGRHLYVCREDGAVFVVDIDKQEVVAKSEMGEFTVSTPVFVNNRILIRTADHLVCIGGK